MANLVLIPRVIAGLSDYCPAIIDVLKYRAWELYGWCPDEETAPMCPEYYPKFWNDFIDDIQDFPAEEPMELIDYLDAMDNEKLSERAKLEEYNNNREEFEIEKVRRKVPGWLVKNNQACTIILNTFMQLSKNGSRSVSRHELKAVSEKAGVGKYEGNYAQMRNFGIKNHAKVFQEIKGYVYLWAPVATFIKGLYIH